MPLDFDLVAEARRNWEAHGGRPDAMVAAISIARAHQIVLARIDAALAPFGLTFSRFEALALLSFSRRGALPMGKIGARLQVHPTSVTNTVNRLERDGLVRRASSTATAARSSPRSPRRGAGSWSSPPARWRRSGLAGLAPRAPPDPSHRPSDGARGFLAAVWRSRPTFGGVRPGPCRPSPSEGATRAKCGWGPPGGGRSMKGRWEVVAWPVEVVGGIGARTLMTSPRSGALEPLVEDVEVARRGVGGRSTCWSRVVSARRSKPTAGGRYRVIGDPERSMIESIQGRRGASSS